MLSAIRITALQVLCIIFDRVIKLSNTKPTVPKSATRSVAGDRMMLGKKSSTAHIRKVWRRLPNISIDYGILEKAANVAAVPAVGIEWSDLGSWESLTEVLPKNKQGNMFQGDVVSVGSKETLVWGGRKIIAAVGLEDIIIIDTPDALLVCRKEASQGVKDVVTHLQKRKRREI